MEAEVFERAPLGKRDPRQLKRAFEKSFLTCFAFDGGARQDLFGAMTWRD